MARRSTVRGMMGPPSSPRRFSGRGGSIVCWMWFDDMIYTFDADFMFRRFRSFIRRIWYLPSHYQNRTIRTSACCVLCIRGTQLCKNGIHCNYYSSLDLDTSDAWKLNTTGLCSFCHQVLNTTNGSRYQYFTVL